jgi:hypothetical protein
MVVSTSMADSSGPGDQSHGRRDAVSALHHARPETTRANYDISENVLERDASHHAAGFFAGCARQSPTRNRPESQTTPASRSHHACRTLGSARDPWCWTQGHEGDPPAAGVRRRAGRMARILRAPPPCGAGSRDNTEASHGDARLWPTRPHMRQGRLAPRPSATGDEDRLCVSRSRCRRPLSTGFAVPCFV